MAEGPSEDEGAVAPVTVRPMQQDDLDGILAIEQVSYPSPWTREVFEGELHRAWAHVDVLRERDDGPVRGYVNYWIVTDEVHVLNVSVHPEARRRGLGGQLLLHVFAVGAERGCHFVTLEVRRSNRAALALYRRHDFRPVGVRPRYYEDREDAIVMLRDL